MRVGSRIGRLMAGAVIECAVCSRRVGSTMQSRYGDYSVQLPRQSKTPESRNLP